MIGVCFSITINYVRWILNLFTSVYLEWRQWSSCFWDAAIRMGKFKHLNMKGGHRVNLRQVDFYSFYMQIGLMCRGIRIKDCIWIGLMISSYFVSWENFWYNVYDNFKFEFSYSHRWLVTSHNEITISDYLEIFDES